jgi:hypothetical protein
MGPQNVSENTGQIQVLSIVINILAVRGWGGSSQLSNLGRFPWKQGNLQGKWTTSADFAAWSAIYGRKTNAE